MKSFLFFTFFVESELVNKGMKGVNLEFKYFFLALRRKKWRKSLECKLKAVSLHRQKRNGWFC